MQITISQEFKRLIPALLSEDSKQLEANILSDGEIKEPLYIWRTEGQSILLDGHNRYRIAEKHGLKFDTTEIVLSDRDHAKLWIATHQLGRRNLTDDQRADIANEVREIRSKIASDEGAAKARAVKADSAKSTESRKERTHCGHCGQDTTDGKKHLCVKRDTRKAVAKEAKLSERKIRLAQEIKKVSPVVSAMVRAGDISLVEGRKIVSLAPEARQIAVEAVEMSIKNDEDVDVRAAIRAAKKENYNAAVAASKPKQLEGTYRIIYADPPWKYIGLNKADEYGHAERHYDCLDDEQLKRYKIGGKRLIQDITDKNAVLFLWVTSPLLERCFPIIKAWGFDYKSSFVWDKVKHNMGHYNSVRHELLLVCTKGSCKPDVSKLVDSVQSIERKQHSEKPEEFRKIIENLYDHGRKLELFSRKISEGWDSDGNEI